MEREIRIDIIRGIAMLTISINHLSVLYAEMGLEGMPVPTLTAFGFSSAAELFFILSGYMVGLVMLGKADLLRNCVARARKIYLFNLAAFICAVMLAFAFGPGLAIASSADFTLEHPVKGTAMFLLMLQHPDLLGVLNYYVIFILLTPAAAVLLSRSSAALATVSISLYALVQFAPSINFPGGSPNDDWRWNFNPLAWQVLFFLPMILGRWKFHILMFDWLERNRMVGWAAMSTLVLAAIASRLEMKNLLSVPLHDKQSIEIVRVMHALVVIICFSYILIICSRFLDWFPFRLTALVGRQTLHCYAFSIVLTYAFAGIWGVTQAGYVGYLISVAMMLASMLFIAAITSAKRLPPSHLSSFDLLEQPR